MSPTQFLSPFRYVVFSIFCETYKIYLFCGLLLAGNLVGCIDNTAPILPPFNLLLVDSATVFSSTDIPAGRPIVLIFFSPDCDHCQAETAGLLSNMDSLKDVRFYFVTTDPFEKLRVFQKYYHLSKYPNIVVGKDYEFSFFNRLKPTATPSTFIYDSHKILQAVLTGNTETENIVHLTKNI